MDFVREIAVKLVAAVLTKQFGIPPANAEKIVRALVDFGYLLVENLKPAFDSNNEVAILSEAQCAIQKYQSFFNLDTTGEVTPQLEGAIDSPRCGCIDVNHEIQYNVLQARWRKTNLKIYVERFLTNISQADQTDIIGIVCNDWMAVGNIQVGLTTDKSKADIVVTTGTGAAHGFQTNSVLAWAQIPQGNDTQLLMKINTAIQWLVTKNKAGVLYKNVFSHELAHNFGLFHDEDPAVALLDPIYNPSIGVPQPNDIRRFRAMYGAATNPPTNPIPSPTPGKKIISLEIDGVVNSAKILSIS